MIRDRITTKLLCSLATLFVFVILAGMMAGARMSRANDIPDNRDAGHPGGLLMMHRIYTDVSDIRRCQLWHIIAKSKEEMNRYDDQIRLLFQRIYDNIARYESLASSKEETMLLGEFKRNWQWFIAEHNTIVELSWQLRKEDALALASGDANRFIDDASRAIVELHAFIGRLFSGARSNAGNRALDSWYMETPAAM